MKDDKIVLAHKQSIRHRTQIEVSTICGCFFCLSVFRPSEISEWCDDDQTALCPNCGIDSVIGAASGYSIEEEFLTEMNQYWF
ncbi:MAG: cytoplasmic protein [Shimia sp.]|uniref:cytoplasmic protein n=1 Tax=Shimia sp. TaxID=1954381 RepID=UPI001B185138|nr:cytoplasmic protein [Shimia sp.]MBO6899645.1 cytoplasmic protein [Shimia sp.]